MRYVSCLFLHAEVTAKKGLMQRNFQTDCRKMAYCQVLHIPCRKRFAANAVKVLGCRLVFCVIGKGLFRVPIVLNPCARRATNHKFTNCNQPYVRGTALTGNIVEITIQQSTVILLLSKPVQRLPWHILCGSCVSGSEQKEFGSINRACNMFYPGQEDKGVERAVVRKNLVVMLVAYAILEDSQKLRRLVKSLSHWLLLQCNSKKMWVFDAPFLQ